MIILKNKNIKKNKCTLIKEIIEMIENHISEKSFIYTKTRDCKIDFYCNKSKIKHKISDIFNNKKNIIPDIILYILPIFKKEKEKNRNFLRLVFFPYILHRVEFPLIKLNNSTIIKGYIKDLSFNGISIILFDNNELSLFRTNSKTQINITLENNNKILIKDAIIIRKSPKKKLICLSYDINNRKIITKKNNDELTALILEYIKNFIYLDIKDN